MPTPTMCNRQHLAPYIHRLGNAKDFQKRRRTVGSGLYVPVVLLHIKNKNAICLDFHNPSTDMMSTRRLAQRSM